MDLDPGFKYMEMFRGCVQWYMIESENFISNISLELKNQNGGLVSLNKQALYFPFINRRNLIPLHVCGIGETNHVTKHNTNPKHKLKNLNKQLKSCCTSKSTNLQTIPISRKRICCI